MGEPHFDPCVGVHTEQIIEQIDSLGVDGFAGDVLAVGLGPRNELLGIKRVAVNLRLADANEPMTLDRADPARFGAEPVAQQLLLGRVYGPTR